jgi:hypothetical protein
MVVNAIIVWLRWLVAGLPSRRPGFAPGSVRVGLMVDKVALGQNYLRVHRFYLVCSILSWLFILIYYLGDEQ